VERREADAIYDDGREVVVGQLTARVERLERELAKNSRNSSRPPSSDPPGAKQTKRARPKGRSGKTQGAQPGHEGKGRELLPSWAVDQVIEHWPARCGCGRAFSDSERVAVGEPVRHQVEELPQISTIVIEHQCLRVRCPDCGRRQRAQLPAEIAGSAFGPRLQAAITTLAIRNRISRRDSVELCSELFGARLCTGSVDQILTRAADALECPHQRLIAAAQRAGRVNMDETGWRLKGQRRTLWGVFTPTLAVYRIAENRHEDRARELLGHSSAIVTSDRWWAYNHLPLARRQICWSHVQRDFQAHAEGAGAEQELGQVGLRVCDELFFAWQVYQHTGQRAQPRHTIRRLQRELKPILRTYSDKKPRYKRTRGLARNLLKV
jgi:transposase